MSVRILQGDCLDALRTLPDASVQCCVTSPPYYGLRDYGVAGQIGLEQSPAEYVARMVEVFREVRRVLRDDGTVWLNLGDSYANYRVGDRGGMPGQTIHGGQERSKPARPNKGNDGAEIGRADGCPRRANRHDGLKEKDLMMMPARVAIALCDDGWYLRSNIIWAKRNCMPESVHDRPTNAHEHIFLLTKRPSYFYDAVAIEEDGEIAAGTRAAKGSEVRSALKDVNGRPPEYYEYTGKRNKRSVWWMATQPFPEAHFATFPPELPEICIKAGTSERGCCAKCGAAWVRQTEKPVAPIDVFTQRGAADDGLIASGRARVDGVLMGAGQKLQEWRNANPERTTGWLPSCGCAAGEPVPCTVLDPFAGVFTTALVADRLGRDCIGIELNPEYCAMARRRIEKDAGLFAEFAA